MSQFFHILASTYLKLTESKKYVFISLFKFFYVIGFRLTITKYAPLIEAWKKINHANIVQLKDVFITKAFNDTCEYCPLLFVK